MKWPERLLLLTIVAAVASLWLPWVWHRDTALVLTGLDLPEFVRFMGEVRNTQIRAYPAAFMAPIVVLALVAAALVARSRWSSWARLLVMVICVWLLALIFPPLERRRELLILLASALVVYMVAILWHPKQLLVWLWLWLAAVLAVLPPLLHFVYLLPALSRLYGRPVALGAGGYVASTSASLVVVGIAGCIRLLLKLSGLSASPSARQA